MNKLGIILTLGIVLLCMAMKLNMFAMNQPGKQPTIKLLTSDEDVIEIPKDIAFQSPFIKNITEDLGELDAPIPLPGVNAQEFNLIINILQAIKNAPDQAKFKREDGKYIAQRIQPLIDKELGSIDSLTIIAQLIYAAQALDIEYIVNGTIRVLVRKALDLFPMATIASIKSIWTSNNITWPDSLNPVLEYQYQLIKNGNIPELSVADYIAINGMPTISQGLYLDNIGLTSPEGLSLIPHITDVTMLVLDGNQLVYLPATIFHGLANLDFLGLTHNNLTQLPETLFNGLIKLEELHLDSNRLTQLPNNLFTGLTSLRYLNLEHNSLTQLPDHLLNGLTDLMELDLSDNQLSTLPPTLFNGLTSLGAVFIQSNLIQQDSLPTTLFNDLNLRKLGVLKQTHGPLDFKEFVTRYFSDHTFPRGYPVENASGSIILRDQ